MKMQTDDEIRHEIWREMSRLNKYELIARRKLLKEHNEYYGGLIKHLQDKCPHSFNTIINALGNVHTSCFYCSKENNER